MVRSQSDRPIRTTVDVRAEGGYRYRRGMAGAFAYALFKCQRPRLHVLLIPSYIPSLSPITEAILTLLS